MEDVLGSILQHGGQCWKSWSHACNILALKPSSYFHGRQQGRSCSFTPVSASLFRASVTGSSVRLFSKLTLITVVKGIMFSQIYSGASSMFSGSHHFLLYFWCPRETGSWRPPFYKRTVLSTARHPTRDLELRNFISSVFCDWEWNPERSQ